MSWAGGGKKNYIRIHVYCVIRRPQQQRGGVSEDPFLSALGALVHGPFPSPPPPPHTPCPSHATLFAPAPPTSPMARTALAARPPRSWLLRLLRSSRPYCPSHGRMVPKGVPSSPPPRLPPPHTPCLWVPSYGPMGCRPLRLLRLLRSSRPYGSSHGPMVLKGVRLHGSMAPPFPPALLLMASRAHGPMAAGPMAPGPWTLSAEFKGPECMPAPSACSALPARTALLMAPWSPNPRGHGSMMLHGPMAPPYQLNLKGFSACPPPPLALPFPPFPPALLLMASGAHGPMAAWSALAARPPRPWLHPLEPLPTPTPTPTPLSLPS